MRDEVGCHLVVLKFSLNWVSEDDKMVCFRNCSLIPPEFEGFCGAIPKANLDPREIEVC